MSTFGPDQSQPPAISNKQLALIVYILYFVAYFTGITALIGVIIAHVQVASADPLLATHYRFQIRTFWIGILYLVIGAIEVAGNVAGGAIEDHQVICPRHGARFCLRTGQALTPPAYEPVRSYPTRVTADGYLEIGSDA